MESYGEFEASQREYPITLTEYLNASAVRAETDGFCTETTLEKWGKCTCGLPMKTASQDRVESEQPSGEFLRVWLVFHEFETHCETWLLAETSFKPGSEKFYTYLPKSAVQDREGKWWMLTHEYHHTKARMEQWLNEYTGDYHFSDSTYHYKVGYVTLEDL
jgi:hypothetical protein